VIADVRPAGWHPGPDCHWESWSRNGEVCIVGLDPPFTGGARLASCLTWLLRSFASHSRQVHDATGVLAFTCTGRRMPSTLAMSMALAFDLALRDPALIHARVRHRGGDVTRSRWPTLWLEGSVYEYVIGRDPFPPVGTPRRKILLLAEERQVYVPARASANLPARARRAWATGLDAFMDLDERDIGGLLQKDEQAFAVNLLVLVHRWPAGKVRPRPLLEESYRRHEGLIGELAPLGGAKRSPVAWHALWRLPPAMTRTEPGARPWMRYPAVSVVAAGCPMH
jgi:hypothetical protein